MNKVTVYFANHEEMKTKFQTKANAHMDASIAPHYKNQIDTVKNDQRKIELLCSGLLLQKILGISKDSDFTISKEGCLYKADGSRNFCISHARDYSILAVADTEPVIGADLEELHDEMDEKQIRHRMLIAKKVFPPALMEEYLSASYEDEPIIFTELWTKVEAALKAEGKGFYTDPLEHPELFDKWKFTSLRYDNHIATIATNMTSICVAEPFVI